jgi:1-acyl-sn-glycerol-3-phosphate acyltransferase
MAVALMNVWVPVLMILETVIGIAVSPLLLVLWLAVTRWPLGKIMRHFVWIYGRVWLWIISPFVRLKVRVTESERLRGPGIYVVNHLSFFDIFFTSALPVFDVILCLRSWPFKLAWYAPFMRWAEYVDVEQLSWDEIVQRVQQIFEKGRSILLFPQGHRSRDGRLTRYYSGAFKLAIQFNVPVIAVCISGTDQMLPPGRHWMAPADVRLECLAPIEPTTFRKELGHIEFRKHVKELMGACLAKGQF